MSLKHARTLLFALLILLTGCSTSTDEVKEIKTADDLRHARVGVVLGTIQDAFVTNEMPEAEIVRVESSTDLFLSLNQGKCDAILIDDCMFEYAKQQFPEMEKVPSNFPPDDYGIGFNKANTELQSRFNVFLKKIRDNGLYQEIYDRWINNYATSQMPEFESYPTGEPLRVAVAGTQHPFAFIKDQELMGFDVELVSWFAQEIQRPIEFQNINFGSVIASLQAGKSDMISAAMVITEEREKMVLFSDPYFETFTVIITIPKESAQVANTDNLWSTIKKSFASNILAEKRYLLILDGLKNTIIISLFSILLGTLLGGVICFMRMSKRSWIRTIAATYISLMRGIPVLVLLMLMFYVFLSELPLNGVQIAIITFALNFSAYVSEMFRTAIQGVDRGQTEAGIALGFSPTQTFYHIVMPQAINSVLPVFKGEMISLIKMTSVVGYIAVEDLTKMSDLIRSRTFDAFFPLVMVSILYFVIAWAFGKALDLLNTKHPSKL